MMNRVAAQPLALASVAIACMALLVTAGCVAALYSGFNSVAFYQRLWGGLLTWSWMSVPYFVIVAAATYLAPCRRRSVALLAASIITTAFAAWETTLCVLYPTSTAPVAFLVMPVLQTLGVLIIVWFSLAFVSPEKRAASLARQIRTSR